MARSSWAKKRASLTTTPASCIPSQRRWIARSLGPMHCGQLDARPRRTAAGRVCLSLTVSQQPFGRQVV
eukprot:5265760-Pyramimonas_sp.AAC.1